MFFFLSMCIKIGIAEVIPVKEVIFHLENDIQNFFQLTTLKTVGGVIPTIKVTCMQ